MSCCSAFEQQNIYVPVLIVHVNKQTSVDSHCFVVTIDYPNCELGELRVVNGPNNRTGRVEICLNGQWGTIIDDGWGTNDAKVACRQLGFAAFGKLEIVHDSIIRSRTIAIGGFTSFSCAVTISIHVQLGHKFLC